MPTDFEEFMVPYLEETEDDESTRVVHELWDGRRLEDAALDAIESLPAKKTRRLRAWVAQASSYSEWKLLEREGWEMERFWPQTTLAREGDRFAVIPPEGIDPFGQAVEGDEYCRAIAAGAGAWKIHYVGANRRIRPGRTALIYTVTSVP